jgi:5-methylcytosine-specific restriction endonuclease McrA
MARNASPKPQRGTMKREKARAKRQAAKADRLVYQAVHARDGRVCQVCGIFCGTLIHLHHIVYRSQGGPTSVDNLLSVCMRCHAGIHARTIEAGR